MRALAVVIALVSLGGQPTAARADAKEDRREVGGLSFALPVGWTFELKGDHAAITHAGTKAYCIMSIYQSRAAGADLDAEFATEWKAVAGTLATRAPAMTRRTVGGRVVIEAAAPTTIEDGTALLERVVVMDGGGGQITTLVVFTADATSARSYQEDIDGVMTSIRFPTTAPSAPAPASPAPGDAAPAPAKGKPVIKTSITIADLVGTWGVGDSSTTTYVDSSSGAYRGTESVFYGESYAVSANGAFTYKFVGASGGIGAHVVKEADSGTIGFSGDFVVLAFKGQRGTRKMHFVSYFTEPNGTTHLVLVPENYKLDAASIANNCGPRGGPINHCISGDSWVRAPSKPQK